MGVTNIVITGVGDFDDYEAFSSLLDAELKRLAQVKGVTPNGMRIVTGDWGHVEKMAVTFAKSKRFPLRVFPTLWDLYGRDAVFNRNFLVTLYAKGRGNFLIVFWDERVRTTNRATYAMMDIARRHGMEVIIVDVAEFVEHQVIG